MEREPPLKRGGPTAKRRKITHEAATCEEVHTSQQLQQLLTFSQDFRAARHGLTSFKNFLDPFVNVDETDDVNTVERKRTLVEYLEAVRPRNDNNDDAIYLDDIMQVWAAASHANNDNVMSAAAVALALLLKVLSSMLEMRQHGLGICRTLLQKRELTSIARNLSVDKGKEFIISPTLRLVREMMCFDGGELAEDVFRERSSTFKALGRNMGIRYLGEGIENPKRPSARTTGIRLFLATLKFVNSDARQELLSQKDIVTALFKGIKDDPPYLIHEILDGLRTSVLGDSKLPSQIKLKVFNAYTVPRLAMLYSYSYDSKEEDPDKRVNAAAHRFLLQLCSSEDGGILRPNPGFYPPGVDPDTVDGGASWRQKFDYDVPVRHSVLLELSKNLKPWSNLKHSELLLEMFRAAPELVAPYFRLGDTFTFDPKLSSTWIGYAVFLFNTAQLPIPPFFGHTKPKCAKLPPPTSIVLDNILPLPLTQKVATKCLAQQSSNLIQFFAVRLLVIAFQKLEHVVSLYEATGLAKWKAEASQLKAQFATRVPSVKDVLKSYLLVPDNNLLHREAASRLLYLYSRALTQSESSSLDISRPLLTVIKRLDNEQENPQDEALSRMELENLVALADISLGVRWFSKTGGLKLSVFTSLLRLSFKAPSEALPQRLLASLHFVADSHHLIKSMSGTSAFTCLFRTLDHLGKKLTEDVWFFLDNCVTRCANTELKYLTMAIELGQDTDEESTEDHISPLTASFHDQFPFVVKSSTGDALVAVTKFLSTYLGYCRTIENTYQLNLVMSSMADLIPSNSKASKYLKKHHDLPPLEPLEDQFNDINSPGPETFAEEGWNVGSLVADQRDLDALLSLEPLPEHDNSALTKWANKPVETLVHDGHIRALILLLTSKHTSIRLEAANNITKLAGKIKDTTSYLPHIQLWLVLMELVETVTPTLAREPAMGIFTSFATHSLSILTKPLHPLYPILNKFLCAGPAWRTSKLPFVSDFLAGDSEAEGSFYIGLVWIFTFLADGMRSPRDVALFINNRRPVERLLSYSWDHAQSKERLRFAALGMISRVADVETGADSLVARLAINSWLQAMEARSKEEDKEREEVACRLLRDKIKSALSAPVRKTWTR